MDSNTALIEKSDEDFEAGRYHDSLKILLDLADGHLSSEQKIRLLRRVVQVKRRLMESQLAIPEARKYVELEKQLSGTNSKNYAIALNELAMVLAKDNNNKARQNIQKAISIMKRLKLEGTEEYGSMLFTLGEVFYIEGMIAEAIDTFHKARAILQSFGKGRDYYMAATDLAICHKKRKNYVLAKEFFQESFSLTLDSVGNKHPDYGMIAYLLGRFYLREKNEQMGYGLLREALEIYKVTFGPKHPQTMGIQARLAEKYLDENAKKAIRDSTEADLATTVTREVMKKLSVVYEDIQNAPVQNSLRSSPETEEKIQKDDDKLAKEILQKATAPGDIFDAIEEYDLETDSETARVLYCALLKPPLASQLIPEERMAVFDSLSRCYAKQDDHKRGLTCTQLYLNELKTLEGCRTKHYALGLEKLAMNYMSLNDLKAVRTFAEQAVEIMREIGREDHKRYAGMIFLLGNAEQREDNFEKALGFYQQAKLLTSHEADPMLYSTLLVCMDLCHRNLNQWDQAYAICREELGIAKENDSRHADALSSLSCVYAKLKQYELAVTALKQAINIRKKEETPKDSQEDNYAGLKRIVNMEADLALLKEKSLVVHRENIEVDHMFRMCNECGKIKYDMDVCNGCCKAWYCDRECQLKHWSIHKLVCIVCFNCEVRLNRDTVFLRCSKCKATKYCGVECQTEDWKEHKKTCTKSTE